MAEKTPKKATAPRSASKDGYGILNRFGDFWSPHLFNSEAEAKSYFDGYWRAPGFQGQEPKWSDYKVVSARSRIIAIKRKSHPSPDKNQDQG